MPTMKPSPPVRCPGRTMHPPPTHPLSQLSLNLARIFSRRWQSGAIQLLGAKKQGMMRCVG